MPIDATSSTDYGFHAQHKQPRKAMLVVLTCSTPLVHPCKQTVSLLLMLVAQFLQPLVVHSLHDIPPVVQLAYFCCMPCCLLLQLPYLPACSSTASVCVSRQPAQIVQLQTTKSCSSVDKSSQCCECCTCYALQYTKSQTLLKKAVPCNARVHNVVLRHDGRPNGLSPSTESEKES